MKKIAKKQNKLTRELLTNPFPNQTLKERLSKFKSKNKEEYNIEDCGNGYIRIRN